MDPLTQGLLGAAAAQVVFGRKIKNSGLIGAAGGMAPDLDVLIRSAGDPLLAVEYHRQFTHSLAFVPVGGLIAALPWIARPKHRRLWKPIAGAAIAGYATHGVLDACTTYGTQLFWPFTNYRVSWSWISIVDPIFTLALLVGVALTALRAARLPAAAALAVCLAYMGLGALQHERAMEAQARIAVVRGHQPVRGDAFPTVGNNVVWRSLYEAGGMLYADRIRVPWFGAPQYTTGTAVRAARESDLPPEQRAAPRIVADYRRFAWFSLDWVAYAPDQPDVIGDVRYSLRTAAFEPIWGVRFHPHRAQPTEWVNRSRDRELGLATLWAEIDGSHPDYVALR